MSLKKFPTVSTRGIMENDDGILNMLFAYFITSEFSQTFFYDDQVASLKYLISKYGNDEDTFKTKIIESLKKLYERYEYTDTDVTVILTRDNENNSIMYIKIDIITFNESKELQLSRTLSVDSDKIIYFNNHLEDLYKKRG